MWLNRISIRNPLEIRNWDHIMAAQPRIKRQYIIISTLNDVSNAMQCEGSLHHVSYQLRVFEINIRNGIYYII